MATPGIFSRQLTSVTDKPESSCYLTSIVDMSKSHLQTTSNGSPLRAVCDFGCL